MSRKGYPTVKKVDLSRIERDLEILKELATVNNKLLNRLVAMMKD